MDFLRNPLIVNVPTNRPKSDDWKWSTDKGAFMIKWFIKKSILYLVAIYYHTLTYPIVGSSNVHYKL